MTKFRRGHQNNNSKMNLFENKTHLRQPFKALETDWSEIFESEVNYSVQA